MLSNDNFCHIFYKYCCNSANNIRDSPLQGLQFAVNGSCIVGPFLLLHQEATQRVVYLRQHFHTLACASCCFFICRFSKNSCLSLDAGSLAMQFFFFLPGKVSKQLWGVYHAPPPKGLVLMGKNLTTLLKADNIVCWIFRAIWATECSFPLFMEYLSKYKRPRFQFKNSLSNFITITCIFTYMICHVAVGWLKWR